MSVWKKFPRMFLPLFSLHIKAASVEDLKQAARKLLKHKDIGTELYFSLAKWADFTHTTL